MYKKIIFLILLFTNSTLAEVIKFDLNLLCETTEIIGDEENNYGTLGTGLVVDSTDNSLYILTKLADPDATYTFSWTDKITSFLEDEVNANDIVIKGELFHSSTDYNLSVFKINTGKLNLKECKFDDPITTDKLYLFIKDYKEENNINKYINLPFNILTLKQKYGKIYFTSPADKDKTVGGGVILNQDDEVVSFIHSTNNNKVVGISGKTIIKYLRSIKYPNEPPTAPTSSLNNR